MLSRVFQLEMLRRQTNTPLFLSRSRERRGPARSFLRVGR
jgi:hypothetical protein